jgi:chromosome segregation ATPase
MKDVMSTLELKLGLMVKSGKSPSAQASIKTAIDELRLDIENLEAENHANQTVYDDLVQEMKAKLEQRIRELKERVKI